MTHQDQTHSPDSAALARKRRKNRLHGESNDSAKRARVESDSDDLPDDVTSMRKKPHITGIKRSTRYDPGVPMTKPELTAWRKEARRVRNRESAAASRRRTRDRINELEIQVDDLQSKYSAALRKIAELEAAALKHKLASVNTHLESAVSVVSPTSSPVIAPVSPVASPRASFRLDSHQEEVEKKYQHIMDMISRPTA
uniref:BZIP domain-containing protein n=1 Tax=Cyclophora tenuis TaxID=216820 RepID=A0A7S1CY60_CYCTE